MTLKEMNEIYNLRPRHYPFFKIQGRIPKWLQENGLRRGDVVVLVEYDTMILRDSPAMRFAAHPPCMKFLQYNVLLEE